MTKVAVRVFKEGMTCEPTAMPGMMNEFFADHKCGNIEYSVISIEGGEIAIVTDLHVDYMGRLEDLLMSLSPADSYVETLCSKFPNSIRVEEEYEDLTGVDAGFINALSHVDTEAAYGEDADEQMNFEYSLPVVFELPPRILAELKWKL